MNNKWFQLFALGMLAITGMAPPAVVLAQPPALTTRIEWNFNQDGNFEGWTASEQFANLHVAGGAMTGTIPGNDPIMFSPLFDFPTRPWQRIEIRIKSDKPGTGSFYYANTQDPPYDGFRPKKVVGFQVLGDNEWHTISIWPGWYAEGHIIHLRLDLFAGQTFAVDWIRVVEPTATTAVTNVYNWDFRDPGHGWFTESGLDGASPTPEGLALGVSQITGQIESPPLELPVGDRRWVVLRMSCDRGYWGKLSWLRSDVPGAFETKFNLRPDGRMHTYNIPVGDTDDWTGTLAGLALRPTNVSGSPVTVQSLALATKPQGAPDLECAYFGLENALNRVGKPCPVLARFVNRGGTTISGARATIQAPAGVTVKAVTNDDGGPNNYEFDRPVDLHFNVQAAAPVEGELTIRLAGEGIAEQVCRAPLSITSRPDVPASDYVPVPQPAKTDYNIGLYYFPRWFEWKYWDPIWRWAPVRKPLLGWYDESNPEVVDWQIKWAVEHGISFFLVDWYWAKGKMSLTKWLHDGYMKARYRDYIKWAVMWANHNPKGSNSPEDWLKVTQYWIDNYFSMPSYQKIDGKPAVYIWNLWGLNTDLGGEKAVKALFDQSQQMARDAGYAGITFISMNGGVTDPKLAQTVANVGYKYHTTYHFFADAPQLAEDPKCYSYSLVVDRSKAYWERTAQNFRAEGVGLLPTADTGWDAFPWHGLNTNKIYGRNAAQFERLLTEAKSYLDANGQKTLILGPCNEWGEGSYIEPATEYGFGMYQAVRKVFGKDPNPPVELGPVDFGMGPYDVPRTTQATIKKPAGL
ncbi:MAG: glycoside hydrolase family 99-like domain-containing protein [bacterium]|nr:glycoside hydrolase family 99-like domain-containing protein [bacterium]